MPDDPRQTDLERKGLERKGIKIGRITTDTPLPLLLSSP